MIELLTFFYHSVGMEHPSMLTTTWFSSLLLPSNLPELKKKHKVIHNIYCSPLDTQFIIENYLPLANKEGLEVNINDKIITDTQNPRLQLHLAIKDQIKKSIENKSIIIFATADAVYGNGLSTLANELKQGEYCVAPVIRISYERGFDKTKNFYKNTNIDNRDIVKFFIEDVKHNLIDFALQEEHEYMHLKKLRDGWAFYHKEPPPIMCYGSNDIFEGFEKSTWGQFEAVDHAIPYLFFERKKLSWVDTSEKFIWGEFTSDNTYKSMIKNDIRNQTTNFFMNKTIYLRTK